VTDVSNGEAQTPGTYEDAVPAVEAPAAPSSSPWDGAPGASPTREEGHGDDFSDAVFVNDPNATATAVPDVASVGTPTPAGASFDVDDRGTLREGRKLA
jgi:hypothetical protein